MGKIQVTPVFSSLNHDRWRNENLGVEVMVGPSKIAPGFGLHIALLNDSLSEVVIPKDSFLCQCSNGEFKSDVEGDKVITEKTGERALIVSCCRP